MRLILTAEVSGLGSAGDVVEVKDGYGRNYLVPQRLAIPATRGAERQIEQIRRARQVRDVRDLGVARQLAADLAGRPVRLAVRAGKGGRLFGSVGAADVVAAVSAAGGPELDRRRVELGGAIKTVGAHQVSVRLHPEVTATLTLDVVAADA